ncbi:sensor histidine kinase [Nocardiopsis metallicus]|uniref:Two-component system sensor histidine kinase DesK n=1 Tax=Nocardiopsis metallicus TaxID=179819 RepID=A0A840WH69_9ACTN|nr:histidine kinase [Nocardiopsis metallicus]MBB5492351.1 two-component system sensor histidine kinase DesK [Nocardiopsis metallicus]
MTFERTEVAQGHLRTLNLNIVAASLSAVGALLISINAQNLNQAVVLGVGLAAGLVALRMRDSDRLAHVLLPCLLVASAVWLYGMLGLDSASASFGLSVVGTVVVLRLPPPHRRAAGLGLAALVVGVVAVKVALSPEDLLRALREYAVGSLSVAVVGVVFAGLDHLVAGLIGELERARERDAELAVARERVRFAGDLHDIQGHTLHVVKLKVALARKLVHSDAEQVERELDEVYELVGDTIAETKELAYAQRRLNLSAELENAKNLFEAAGISVSVDREPPDSGGAGPTGGGTAVGTGDGDRAGTAAAELLGQVLRETTTNILRHAQAGQVRITLSETGITIVNDGAHGDGAPELSGLSALRERVERDGGTLRVEREDGRFLTAATFPRRKDDR